VKSAIIIVLTLLTMSCSSMGSDPDGQRLEIIKQSKQYNLEKESFENSVEIPLSTGRSFFSIFIDFIADGDNRRPKTALPEDKPEISDLKNKSEDLRFIWFGHSTLLVDINKVRLLIDPVFSDYASPVNAFAKRFQSPVLAVNEIPDIDLVIISHDHYDHLDYETILELKDNDIKYIVPLGVGAHLEGWGVAKEKITELDWWDKTNVKGLEISCTPAQHFSGRGLLNGNSTLWSSWAIKGKDQNTFFSGDSGYGEHYKEIGEKLGPFDVVFLENGAYSLGWKFVHQLPEEAVQAFIDLKGQKLVPVHWGMFDLALHSWHEPIERVTAEAKKRDIDIITPRLGQLVSIKQKSVFEDWWSELIHTLK